ncbi:uncharacterized protein LOC113334720 isoform X2 [Papaver somniferum]|uniref:uncharacterized protein LOC113334720 isoform X2 n=1 Tax=Papaver somniferum TaxID=3469 RepID=UPI000E6F6B4B|nr:uncharacterized protein LOC113334720 isoform X2 [Papaver somniferum]
MDEDIRISTSNDDGSEHRRRQQYRLNARQRLSNLTAEERSHWLAMRNESQRQRRRAIQYQFCVRPEIGRQIRLQRQTSELERQLVRHRDAVVIRARSTNAGPSHRVVAWEQPINNIGADIPRGARLSSIKRLARDQCSTTTETFGQNL